MLRQTDYRSSIYLLFLQFDVLVKCVFFLSSAATWGKAHWCIFYIPLLIGNLDYTPQHRDKFKCSVDGYFSAQVTYCVWCVRNLFLSSLARGIFDFLKEISYGWRNDMGKTESQMHKEYLEPVMHEMTTTWRRREIGSINQIHMSCFHAAHQHSPMRLFWKGPALDSWKWEIGAFTEIPLSSRRLWGPNTHSSVWLRNVQ